MRYLRELLSNYIFLCAAASWLTAQIIKTLFALHSQRSWRALRAILSNGGMPSSHSSCVCALCAASIGEYGLGSFQFAITAILAAIVMNDASGVRYETGKQSRILNRLFSEGLFPTQGDVPPLSLKEIVGHTPLQVFMGALLGIAMAAILYPFLG